MLVAAAPLFLLLHGHQSTCSENRSQLTQFVLNYEVDGYIQPLEFTTNFSADVCNYEAIVPFGVKDMKVDVLPWSINEWDQPGQLGAVEVNGNGIDCDVDDESCDVASVSAFGVINAVVKIWTTRVGGDPNYMSNYTVVLKQMKPDNFTCETSVATQLENLSLGLKVNGEEWPSTLTPAFHPDHCEYTIQVPKVLTASHVMIFHPILRDPNAKIEFVQGKTTAMIMNDADYEFRWELNRGKPFDMHFLIFPEPFDTSGAKQSQYHIRAIQSAVDTDPIVSKLWILANGKHLVLEPPLHGNSDDPTDFRATCAVPILSAPQSLFIYIFAHWPKTTQIYFNAQQMQRQPSSGERIPLNLTSSIDFAAATIQVLTINKLCTTCSDRQYRVTVKWLFPYQPLESLSLYAMDAQGRTVDSVPAQAMLSDSHSRGEGGAGGRIGGKRETKGWMATVAVWLGVDNEGEGRGIGGAQNADGVSSGMGWYEPAMRSSEAARVGSMRGNGDISGRLASIRGSGSGGPVGNAGQFETPAQGLHQGPQQRPSVQDIDDDENNHPQPTGTPPLVLNPAFKPNPNLTTNPSFRSFTSSTFVPHDATHVLVVASVLSSLVPQEVRGVQISMVHPPLGLIESGARTLVPLDPVSYLPNKIQLELAFTLCNDCSTLHYEGERADECRLSSPSPSPPFSSLHPSPSLSTLHHEVDVYRSAPPKAKKTPVSIWHSPITIGLSSVGSIIVIVALYGMFVVRRQRTRTEGWSNKGMLDPILTGQVRWIDGCCWLIHL
jgi:hypothetical protein